MPTPMLINLTKIAIVATALALLPGCTSMSKFNPFSTQSDPSGNSSQSDNSNELSEQEQAKRDALVRGKSARPGLKSLNLEPVRLEKLIVPSLTLWQKRDEYEALLPLIQDPIQKQQVAFRLADIKMLIAEQEQQDGRNLQVAQASFSDAISDYREVLTQHSIVLPAPGIVLDAEQQALNRKQMDAMYQLTRALDLSAQPEQSMLVAQQFLDTFSISQFNVTPYHIELYFRMGEYYFNRQQYPSAAQYYGQVLKYANGETEAITNFHAISAYMLGWSQFKLDNYPQAMQAFATMLDVSLVTNSQINPSDLEKQAIDELAIRKGDLRLVKDAIRVMALTFSYQGNGDAIVSFFEAFGARDYEQLIYNELAQQHLDNDRFQDSANVLITFARHKPLHPRAIEFYIRHIDAFVLGDFPARVLLAKEDFVATYSLGNGVVASLDTPIGRAASPYLREYLQQLAQTEHSIAQSIDALLAERNSISGARQGKENIAPSGSGFIAQQTSMAQTLAWDQASNKDLSALSQQAYTKAKGYYQNFIATFTPSPQAAELRFYLAEALLALNEFEAAITEFETFAYVDAATHGDLSALGEGPRAIPKPVEAAYAALLVYQEMVYQEMVDQQTAQPSKAAQNLRSTMPYQSPLTKRQVSQAKFATSFAQDGRAPAVVLTLMQDLFAQQNYFPAQEWATWLLLRDKIERRVTNIDNEMKESARLVMAHSYFAMQMYSEAEAGYRELLLTLSANDTRLPELGDRLAASLYKQAETILLANKLDSPSLQAQNITVKAQLTPRQVNALETGVGFLQQVVNETGQSEFRLAAQYDSAVYFSLLENWPQAIATYIDFQNRYPQHPLTQGIDDQLFYAYEQTENWPQAASILMAKFNQSPNSELGRLALYQAAQYYEKAGDRDSALEQYRSYAHQFPMPLGEANEARFMLSEFYRQTNEENKRRFWLNKLVQAQQIAMQQIPKASTPRSIYLGSMAAMVFADDADIAYTRIKLTQPLDRSLQQKQAALTKAIVEYERVISFASAQHVTAANYKLARLYTTLATDLMESSRPDGLSALELSQYEILLEEQAYPFEETAIGLHEKNIARVRTGLYDSWVKGSFLALENAMPARYKKPQISAEVTIDDL